MSLIKPIGAENEHPGYTNVTEGSGHLVELLSAIQNSRCAKDTMVVVTYDEFGGQWDHVPPPGPGRDARRRTTTWARARASRRSCSRPACATTSSSTTSQHDTTSIMATIEHRFGLPPVSSRDAAVNDLSSVFSAREPHRGHCYGR